MTALLFEAGGQRYGLDVSRIVEVVPAVPLRPLAGVPASVAGLLGYRGRVVPVLDVSRMIGAASAAPRLSTRVVIVRYQPKEREERLLGLLVERAAQGISAMQDLGSSGIATPESPYLGPLATTGDGRETLEGVVQVVHVDHVIPDDLRARLFADD